jgi:hypothetical protein
MSDGDSEGEKKDKLHQSTHSIGFAPLFAIHCVSARRGCMNVSGSAGCTGAFCETDRIPESDSWGSGKMPEHSSGKMPELQAAAMVRASASLPVAALFTLKFLQGFESFEELS